MCWKKNPFFETYKTEFSIFYNFIFMNKQNCWHFFLSVWPLNVLTRRKSRASSPCKVNCRTLQRTHCTNWRHEKMEMQYACQKYVHALYAIPVDHNILMNSFWIENDFSGDAEELYMYVRMDGLVFVLLRSWRQLTSVHWSKLADPCYSLWLRYHRCSPALIQRLWEVIWVCSGFPQHSVCHGGAYGTAVCPPWMPKPSGWHLLGLSTRLHTFPS